MLKHITINKCQECGETFVVMETRSKNAHVNGDHWEERRFACGFVVNYIPNFRDTYTSGYCEQSAKFKIQEEKRKIAKERLIKYIKGIDVDKDYKDKLLMSIR